MGNGCFELVREETLSYTPNGNITDKTDAGEYAYLSNKASASYAMGGIGQNKINDMKNRYGKFGVQLARQVGAGYLDYHLQQSVHSVFSGNPYYMPWRYNSSTNELTPYSNTKLVIQGYKALFYGLKL